MTNSTKHPGIWRCKDGMSGHVPVFLAGVFEFYYLGLSKTSYSKTGFNVSWVPSSLYTRVGSEALVRWQDE